MNETAGFEELKAAILRMIGERVGKRALDWQTAEQALALAAYEIKVIALRQAGSALPDDAPSQCSVATDQCGIRATCLRSWR
jgi:hypothetical protein